MNNKQIEASLKKAVKGAPVIPFDRIADTAYVKMTVDDKYTRQEEAKSFSRIGRRLAVAVSFCILLLVVASGWYARNRIPDSVISLDVNPSFRFVTNSRDQILSAEALNDDAAAVLKDINVTGSDLTDAVNVLLTALISRGYLNSEKKTLLVSVVNKDENKANGIADNLDEIIHSNLAVQNISPLVLKQALTEQVPSELAEKYHISDAKLQLITLIAASDRSLSLDSLAAMSVEKLVALAKQNSVDLSSIVQYDPSEDTQIQVTDAEDSAGGNIFGTSEEDSITGAAATDADQEDSDLEENDEADSVSGANVTSENKTSVKRQEASDEEDNEDADAVSSATVTSGNSGKTIKHDDAKETDDEDKNEIEADDQGENDEDSSEIENEDTDGGDQEEFDEEDGDSQGEDGDQDIRKYISDLYNNGDYNFENQDNEYDIEDSDSQGDEDHSYYQKSGGEDQDNSGDEDGGED